MYRFLAAILSLIAYGLKAYVEGKKAAKNEANAVKLEKENAIIEELSKPTDSKSVVDSLRSGKF